MNKMIVGVIGLIGLVVVGAAAWFLASPLFIDNVVDEAFPVQLPSSEELARMSEEDLKQMETEAMEAAAAMPEPVSVNPSVLSQGQFEDADSFHKGSGLATIYQLPDGGQVLRFENFETTNGPDLHVLLAKHPAPASRDQLHEGYVDLGSLKGNIGNQNYEIPAGTDLSEYNSVVIYCMPFHVIFSTATLQ